MFVWWGCLSQQSMLTFRGQVQAAKRGVLLQEVAKFLRFLQYQKSVMDIV